MPARFFNFVGASIVGLLLGVSACLEFPVFSGDTRDDGAVADQALPDLAGADLLDRTDLLAGTDLAGGDGPPGGGLTAAPVELHFGAQPLGRLGTPGLDVRIDNLASTSTGPLTASLVGGSAAFRVIGNTCAGGLSASAFCTVTVGYVPSSTTQETGTLRVADGDGTRFIEVPLDGNASGGCLTGFSGGTVGGSANLTNGGTILRLPSGSTDGTFQSTIFDLNAPRTFGNLRWRPARPYRVPLPDDAILEIAYPAGNADMRQNVLLLHLDETSTLGGFADTSGKGHDAACTTCPIVGDPASFGAGLYFDGLAVDRVVVPNHADLEPAGVVTLEAWARPTAIASGQTGAIAGKGRNDAGEPYGTYAIEYEFGAGFRCYLGTVSGPHPRAYGPSATPQGAFHHVACVYDGSNLVLYVDGVAGTPVARTGAIAYGLEQNDLSLGAWGASTGSSGINQPFLGAIDEVAVHTRALSAAEIQNHFLRGALRLGLRVRSCSVSDCSGEALGGPGGSGVLFYDEACGPTGDPRSLALAASCGGQAGGPAANRYWQVGVTLSHPTTPIDVEIAVDEVSLCE